MERWGAFSYSLSDLHARNILLQAASIDALGPSDIYQRFGEPFKIPVTRADKTPTGPEAPEYSVIPVNLIVPASRVRDCRIKISDFGTSFTANNLPTALHTPTVLLPPEALFHEEITSAADVWTLGCTLYDVLGERPLFETWAGDPDDVIGEMVSTLGPLPKRWWSKWEAGK